MIPPGISIIVPTYNRAGYLTTCLDSILCQMGPEDELLVVNDGSTDQTEAVLGRYSDRLRAITVANGGKAAAMNLGLEETDRPFVWIVDDDDIVASGARERLMGLFRDDPDAGFAYGRHLRFRAGTDESEPEIFDTGHWVECEADRFLTATLEDMFVHQPGMIVRRSLYERVGLFDRQLNRSVDYEMLIRLAASGRAAATENVVFYQRQHAGARGSAAERIAPEQREKSWLAYDEKIFREVHQKLPLAAYVPSRQLGSQMDHRRALVQRGTIMMRKNLWDLAMADFHRARVRGGVVDRGGAGNRASCLLVEIWMRWASRKRADARGHRPAGARVCIRQGTGAGPYARPVVADQGCFRQIQGERRRDLHVRGRSAGAGVGRNPGDAPPLRPFRQG